MSGLVIIRLSMPIEAAFQKVGVEFLNHGQPGVRLNKSKAKRKG